MIEKSAFDNLASNATKYEIYNKNYLVSQGIGHKGAPEDEKLAIYDEPAVEIQAPKISIWAYMKRADIEYLMELKKSSQIRLLIESNLKNTRPRGAPRIIFRELMYNVTKFCKSSNFSIEQTGAVLAQFYLAHIFFTSSLNIGPEKLYDYFRDLQLRHSLPFPPDSRKLFDLNQSKATMMYFCKLYLRNLPLIRILSLPNYVLCASYKLEPPMKPVKKKKDKKAKKGKKKK